MNPQTDFTEGDIFYTLHGDEYHIFKLLFFEKDFNCYHVLVYAPLNSLPDASGADTFDIMMYHTPIDKNGFPGAQLVTNRKVKSDELIGYHEYLRLTKSVEYRANLANEYFKKAYDLTDEKKYDDAIDFYSKAFDLFPQYYEAMDNRAFCKMDLGLWEEAIDDFRISLEVNPVSVLAEFSIGECYLRLKEYVKAKQQFEKALEIDPTHTLSKDFLIKTENLMKG